MKTIEQSDRFSTEQKELLLAKKDVISALNAPTDLEESIVLALAPFEMPRIPSDSPLVQELFGAVLGAKHQNIKAAFSHLIKTLTGPGKQAFLKKEREALQGFIKALYPKLCTLKTKEEHFWGAALVGQFLSYYTFFDPQEGEVFSVPVDLEGSWHLIDYKVEKIPLTPSWMGSQAVAFGLTPLEKTPPLLLFKGTSYPTDEGFCLQLLTDFNPFASVGSYLFWLGSENVEKWLKKSPVKSRVFGMSLGGSLTELAALYFPSLIETGFAYNPPSLLPWEVRNSKEHSGIHIFCNENDLSSVCGFSYGKGWNLYKVLVKNPSFFLPAHVQCYLGRKDAIIVHVKHPKKTLPETLFALAHLVISIPVFLIGCILYVISSIFSRKKP